MPRFFVDQPLEGQVFLGGEDGRHMAKSLRMRPGEEVTLCDGRGADAPCKVLSSRGRGRCCRWKKPAPASGEPQTKVTVCQCLCQGGQAGDCHPKGRGAGRRGDLARGERPVRGEAGWEIRPEKDGPAAKNRPGSRHAKRPGRHPPGAGARLPRSRRWKRPPGRGKSSFSTSGGRRA